MNDFQFETELRKHPARVQNILTTLMNLRKLDKKQFAVSLSVSEDPEGVLEGVLTVKERRK